MVRVTRPKEPASCCGRYNGDVIGSHNNDRYYIWPMRFLRFLPAWYLKLGLFTGSPVLVCDHCTEKDRKGRTRPKTQCEGCHTMHDQFHWDQCASCGCGMRLSRTTIQYGDDPRGHICRNDPRHAQREAHLQKQREERSRARAEHYGKKVRQKMGIPEGMDMSKVPELMEQRARDAQAQRKTRRRKR